MSRHGTYDIKCGFVPDDDCPQEMQTQTNADRIRAIRRQDMIEIRGQAADIQKVVQAIAPGYPKNLEGLYPGEWYYVLNGVPVALTIEEDDEACKK